MKDQALSRRKDIVSSFLLLKGKAAVLKLQFVKNSLIELKKTSIQMIRA